MTLHSLSLIALYLSYILSQYGVLKLYKPTKSTILDYFTNDVKGDLKINDIKNITVESINNTITSKFKIYDSVIPASLKLEKDFFNVILLFMPFLILLFGYLVLEISGILLSISMFVNLLILINRYKLFDDFSKVLTVSDERSAISYLKNLPILNQNLSLFQNFIFFPLIDIFAIYIAFFV